MVNEAALDTVQYPAIAKAAIWMVNHLGWGMLIMTAFLVIPTWMLFRYAPRHSFHTIPEGIYIQLFMSTLVLIIFVLSQSIAGWLLWLVPVYYYIAFRQLFGYGVWGTLWRTVLTLSVSLFLALVLSLETLYLTGHIETDDDSRSAYTIGLVFFIAVSLGILYIGYRIGKHRGKKL